MNVKKMSENSGTRLSWVDAAKGFAMIIIIWGHVQQSSPLKTWLTSFHVPTFLVLTGILFTLKGRVGGGKNLIRKLLKPYMTFSAIAIILYFIYDWFFGGISNCLYQTIVNTYKTITGYGILAIWFIPSYFIACFVFSKTYHLSLRWQVCLMLLWGIIGILGSELFVFLRQIVTNSFYYDQIYYPVAAILRGVACTYYIVLGKLFYNLFAIIQHRKRLKLILTIIALISFVCSIYVSQYLTGNFSLLILGARPCLQYLCGTLGSLWVILLFYLLKEICSCHLLQWIGRESLTIMGTHMSLLLTAIIPRIVCHFVGMPEHETTRYYLFGLVCVVVILFIEIPIVKVFNGPLYFLISPKQKTD